jgi:hypothetical protein
MMITPPFNLSATSAIISSSHGTSTGENTITHSQLSLLDSVVSESPRPNPLCAYNIGREGL